MICDFDTLPDRRKDCSIKWDIKENEIPMWIADMDFLPPKEMTDALISRAGGTFGYTGIPDEWYDAYIGFWKERYGFEIQKEWMLFSTGVVPTISSAVRKLTSPGEKVVVMSPVYNIFYNSIYNNGRFIEECPLSYEGGEYSLDLDRFEKTVADPQVSLLIFCNPHNPVGKIWNKDEIGKIGALCHKYGVKVISDEIHCSITTPGIEYTPFASVSDICKEISLTCISPTKAFSIPGLQTSCVFVPDRSLRHKIFRAINNDEIAEPNSFAIDAVTTAFGRCGYWLDAMREYVYKNKKTVYEFIEKNIPEIKAIRSDATYLIWLDCSGSGLDDPAEYVREKTGLVLSDGAVYRGNGKNFMRMNVACPAAIVNEGLSRLKAAFDTLREEKKNG